jgi:hypothetical protein
MWHAWTDAEEKINVPFTSMKYEKYQLESDRKLLLFEFTSVGPKGRIKKLVQAFLRRRKK